MTLSSARSRSCKVQVQQILNNNGTGNQSQHRGQQFWKFSGCENIRVVHRGEEEGADPEVKWSAETCGDLACPLHALQGGRADCSELPRSYRALALVEVIDVAIHTPTPTVQAWLSVCRLVDTPDKPREQLAVAALGIEVGEHHIYRRHGVSNNEPAHDGLEF